MTLNNTRVNSVRKLFCYFTSIVMLAIRQRVYTANVSHDVEHVSAVGPLAYIRGRHANGEPLGAIAADLGVSVPLVSQWIAGTRVISRPVAILVSMRSRSAQDWPAIGE